MKSENDFPIWKSILETVDSLEQVNKNGSTSKKELLDHLEGLQSRVEDRNDPVDHFEIFVMSRLCRTLRESLELLND